MLVTRSACSHSHPYSASTALTWWSLYLRVSKAGAVEDYNCRVHLQRVDKPFPRAGGEGELCPSLGKQVKVLYGRRESGKHMTH